MKKDLKNGIVFTHHSPEEQTPFERLFDVFQELITHTSGDFDEAMDWLKQLDDEYELTTEDYTLEDFVEDLKKKGYIREEVKPFTKTSIRTNFWKNASCRSRQSSYKA